MVALFLIFLGPSILFSIAAAPMYVPTNSAGGFPLSLSMPTLVITCLIATILTGVGWYLVGINEQFLNWTYHPFQHISHIMEKPSTGSDTPVFQESMLILDTRLFLWESNLKWKTIIFKSRMYSGAKLRPTIPLHSISGQTAILLAPKYNAHFPSSPCPGDISYLKCSFSSASTEIPSIIQNLVWLYLCESVSDNLRLSLGFSTQNSRNLSTFGCTGSLLLCVRAFSSCSERALLFVAVPGLLIAVASLIAEHRL